jgi:hypothetical protein
VNKYLGVPVARNCANIISIANAKLGPTLTFSLIPSGLTHHPFISPLAVAPITLAARENVNTRGAGECATGISTPAERDSCGGLVSIESWTGVVLIPLPRSKAIGVAKAISSSNPDCFDQEAFKVRPGTGLRFRSLRIGISLSVAQI